METSPLSPVSSVIIFHLAIRLNHQPCCLSIYISIYSTPFATSTITTISVFDSYTTHDRSYFFHTLENRPPTNRAILQLKIWTPRLLCSRKVDHQCCFMVEKKSRAKYKQFTHKNRQPYSVIHFLIACSVTSYNHNPLVEVDRNKNSLIELSNLKPFFAWRQKSMVEN